MYEKELNEHKESVETYNLLCNFFAVFTVVLFFIGLCITTIALVYLSFVSLIICLFFMSKRDKHSLIVCDIEHKQRMQILDERLDVYNSVKATALKAYQKVCGILEKPEETYIIYAFRSESLQEITELQSEGDF